MLKRTLTALCLQFCMILCLGGISAYAVTISTDADTNQPVTNTVQITESIENDTNTKINKNSDTESDMNITSDTDESSDNINTDSDSSSDDIDTDSGEDQKDDVDQILERIELMSNDVIMTSEGLVGTPGDADGDDNVTASDALKILRASVKLDTIDPSQKDLADVNGDGVIDNYDALTILRSTIGLRDSVFTYDEGVEGIDVSYCQTYIDFEELRRETNIDFVIIRAGYSQTVDPWFEDNYQRAKEQGFNVGVYWYSYADSVEAAQLEAETCASVLEGKYFEYPIFFDIEESWQLARGAGFCSSIVDSFCSTLQDNGWYPGFYTSASFGVSYLYQEIHDKYDYWLAQWSDQVTYGCRHVIWQYGLGDLAGINGPVDVDFSYANYPRYMRFYKLNGN